MREAFCFSQKTVLELFFRFIDVITFVFIYYVYACLNNEMGIVFSCIVSLVLHKICIVSGKLQHFMQFGFYAAVLLRIS